MQQLEGAVAPLPHAVAPLPTLPKDVHGFIMGMCCRLFTDWTTGTYPWHALSGVCRAWRDSHALRPWRELWRALKRAGLCLRSDVIYFVRTPLQATGHGGTCREHLKMLSVLCREPHMGSGAATMSYTFSRTNRQWDFYTYIGPCRELGEECPFDYGANRNVPALCLTATPRGPATLEREYHSIGHMSHVVRLLVYHPQLHPNIARRHWYRASRTGATFLINAKGVVFDPDPELGYRTLSYVYGAGEPAHGTPYGIFHCGDPATVNPPARIARLYRQLAGGPWNPVRETEGDEEGTYDPQQWIYPSWIEEGDSEEDVFDLQGGDTKRAKVGR